MKAGMFQPGDWVIYRKTKHSLQPGPRAENVSAARFGDSYSYTVDKFWVVRKIQTDGSLLLETRRGKQHTVRPDDPCLRRANLWQRLWYRNRFEATDSAPASKPTSQSSAQQEKSAPPERAAQGQPNS